MFAFGYSLECGRYTVVFIYKCVALLFSLHFASGEIHVGARLFGRECIIGADGSGAYMSAFVGKRGFNGDDVAHATRYVSAQRDGAAVGTYGTEVARLHFRGYAARLELSHHYPSANLVEQYTLNAAVKRAKPTLIGSGRLPMGHDVLAVFKEFKLHAERILRGAAEAVVAF